MLGCEELNNLTIRITSNKGWVVFSSIQGIDQGIKYSTKTKLGILPEELCLAKNLEDLDVSDLGISQLPEIISNLSKLRLLDISFNRIDVAKEVEKILSMRNLEVLKIYGCNFTEHDFTKINNAIPNLKILFSQEHLLDEAKSKAKDKKN